MTNINGATPENPNITEGESLGIGLTLDRDGDPIVLLWVSHGGNKFGVALTEDAALALAQSLIGMASEITQLGDIANISPEELNDRMERVVRGVAEKDPNLDS